eukprot:3924067-Rhodomonas_salina.2
MLVIDVADAGPFAGRPQTASVASRRGRGSAATRNLLGIMRWFGERAPWHEDFDVVCDKDTDTDAGGVPRTRRMRATVGTREDSTKLRKSETSRCSRKHARRKHSSVPVQLSQSRIGIRGVLFPPHFFEVKSAPEAPARFHMCRELLSGRTGRRGGTVGLNTRIAVSRSRSPGGVCDGLARRDSQRGASPTVNGRSPASEVLK